MSQEKPKLKIFQPVMIVLPPEKMISKVRMGIITEAKNDFRIKDTDGNDFYSKLSDIKPFVPNTVSESGYIVVTADNSNKILYWGKNASTFVDSPDIVEPFKSVKQAHAAWTKMSDTIPAMKEFDHIILVKNEALRRYKKCRRDTDLNKLKNMLEVEGKNLLDSKVKRYNSFTYEEIMAVTTEIQLELDNL